MTNKSLTFVLGGVRSGKSRYAQALALKSEEVVFLATAQATDEEMCAKIEQHRQERPSGWKTVEVPFDLDHAILEQGASSSFLIIDCMTTYTANLLIAKQASRETILHCIDAVCDALLRSRASVAVISNEVGSGIVPEFPAGRAYRDILGEVNQRIARVCDNLVLMVAGCPLWIKTTAEVRS